MVLPEGKKGCNYMPKYIGFRRNNAQLLVEIRRVAGDPPPAFVMLTRIKEVLTVEWQHDLGETDER